MILVETCGSVTNKQCIMQERWILFSVLHLHFTKLFMQLFFCWLQRTDEGNLKSAQEITSAFSRIKATASSNHFCKVRNTLWFQNETGAHNMETSPAPWPGIYMGFPFAFRSMKVVGKVKLAWEIMFIWCF